MRIIAGVVVGFAAVAVGVAARGQTVTASGRGDQPGETLDASATFAISNLNLIVTVSNTGTFDPVNANDILSAVFFTLGGDLKLTPVSAELASGSSIIAQRLPLGFDGNVGSEWAYRNDLAGAPNETDEGISSTSLKWFSTKNLFPSEKIKGFASFGGGISFGITTLDDLGVDNRGNIKNQALIQNSVVFTFSGLPDDFSLGDISDVTFQYGTSLKAPDLIGGAIQNIPEPSTIALVVTGLIGALAAARCGCGRKSTVVH